VVVGEGVVEVVVDVVFVRVFVGLTWYAQVSPRRAKSHRQE